MTASQSSPCTLAIASFSVSIACGLAALSKPIWLSDICRKVKPLDIACAASASPSRLERDRHAARQRPQDAGAGPDHAFERMAAADAVASCIVVVVGHIGLLSTPLWRMPRRPADGPVYSTPRCAGRSHWRDGGRPAWPIGREPGAQRSKPFQAGVAGLTSPRLPPIQRQAIAAHPTGAHWQKARQASPPVSNPT